MGSSSPVICFALFDPVTLTFDLSTPKPYRLLGSPIILVLQHQTYSRNSDGVTFGGAKYRWGIKIREFLPISRYISQDIAIVTTEGE